MIAARSGHLEFANNAFHVRPVLEIKGDVDYGTGNIDFNGDVHIFGDVREGFDVRATGTIIINGLVEAATVEEKTKYYRKSADINYQAFQEQGEYYNGVNAASCYFLAGDLQKAYDVDKQRLWL